ncbi:MAG: ATP-dependent helicase [Ruminococcus sp.]|nr:ATP-dependent helicase [Ruminococcus sp.]
MPEITINPIQKQAIESAAGPLQVLAGPGSGKTFVLTRRIRYLIEHDKADPAAILVITFTKAAALEMQQRFGRLMKENCPPVSFGTFHAIFYHILKQNGQYRQYTLITETEKRKLLLQILKMPQSALLSGNDKIEYLLRAISRLKNTETIQDKETAETVKSGKENPQTSTDGPFSEEELHRIYEEYGRFMEEFHKLDFDDMALHCLRMFKECPQILTLWQKRYQYIMVDEFQDINPVQYEIVKLLAAPQDNLFIVGDDDQSIYGFRGARPDIMRRFMVDYPQAGQLLLDVNYRCHEQIVESSLKVITENQNRFPKAIQAAHREGAGLILQPFADREQLYEALLNELKDYTDKTEPERLAETALIYRTNYECSLLAEKLLVCGIPFVMKEQIKSRYDHFIIKDILAYLTFAAGERRRDIFHLFMNRPLRYLRKDCATHDPVDLRELLAYYQDDTSMQEVSRRLFYDLERLAAMRPHLAIRYIRKVIGYDDFLKANHEKETYDKLMEIADDFQAQAKQFAGFEELNDYISQCRTLIRKKTENLKSLSEKEKNGIRLMTMHASKGLEFDRVYLPDINEGKVPSRASVTKDAVEEERRMFYVAMTRARKELHLLYCTGENGKDRASRFLSPLL